MGNDLYDVVAALDLCLIRHALQIARLDDVEIVIAVRYDTA
jgi:hypothetical protein